MVTPSLQTTGTPKRFWISTHLDFGPRVTRTASASADAPRRIFSRASERNSTCLYAMGRLLSEPFSSVRLAKSLACRVAAARRRPVGARPADQPLQAAGVHDLIFLEPGDRLHALDAFRR